MGRVASMNAHVLELQMQFPAIGSQNGVEQLDDTVQNPVVRDRSHIARTYGGSGPADQG
jgi:hypothetical protein